MKCDLKVTKHYNYCIWLSLDSKNINHIKQESRKGLTHYSPRVFQKISILVPFQFSFSLFICQKKKYIDTDIQYITKMLFKDYRDVNYE